MTRLESVVSVAVKVSDSTVWSPTVNVAVPSWPDTALGGEMIASGLVDVRATDLFGTGVFPAPRRVTVTVAVPVPRLAAEGPVTIDRFGSTGTTTVDWKSMVVVGNTRLLSVTSVGVTVRFSGVASGNREGGGTALVRSHRGRGDDGVGSDPERDGLPGYHDPSLIVEGDRTVEAEVPSAGRALGVAVTVVDPAVTAGVTKVTGAVELSVIVSVVSSAE